MITSLVACLMAFTLTTTQAEINEYIVDICEQYTICPELVQAIIEVESNYDIDAENGDCKGLMQVSVQWHKDRMDKLEVTDIMQPYCNILVGVDYLAELRDEYQDLGLCLMIYNMKRSTAFKLYEKGELSSYATKILERSAELEIENGK